jgi:hypothetical protein
MERHPFGWAKAHFRLQFYPDLKVGAINCHDLQIGDRKISKEWALAQPKDIAESRAKLEDPRIKD